MNIVDPIKSIDDLNKIKNYFKHENLRNYLLFIIGINTGIKSNLILNLKLSDVLNNDNSIKNNILIGTQTHKINIPIKEAIDFYLFKNSKDDNLNLNSYLFQSNKGNNKPINRSQLYRILNNAISNCNINLHIGNETLRKTFGYHYYKKTNNIDNLKAIFNINSRKKILKYIGIDEEETNINFCL